jgi:hypothetical protein
LHLHLADKGIATARADFNTLAEVASGFAPFDKWVDQTPSVKFRKTLQGAGN